MIDQLYIKVLHGQFISLQESVYCPSDTIRTSTTWWRVSTRPDSPNRTSSTGHGTRGPIGPLVPFPMHWNYI